MDIVNLLMKHMWVNRTCGMPNNTVEKCHSFGKIDRGMISVFETLKDSQTFYLKSHKDWLNESGQSVLKLECKIRELA